MSSPRGGPLKFTNHPRGRLKQLLLHLLDLEQVPMHRAQAGGENNGCGSKASRACAPRMRGVTSAHGEPSASLCSRSLRVRRAGQTRTLGAIASLGILQEATPSL